MPDDPIVVEPRDVYALLVQALEWFEERSEIRADGVWLCKWPSVRFSVERALVVPAESAWTAWLDVTCTYNTKLPFTAAKSHVIGLGGERAGALSDAVENWRKGVAPALISYIYGFLKGDADTWPPDHPRAIAGWNCINGPYVLRGDATKIEPLVAFLQQHALVDPVREYLGRKLDRDAALHTVSLYRGQMSSSVFADVLIDNRPDAAAGELLRQMEWPKELRGSQLISVRHFLLCLAAQ